MNRLYVWLLYRCVYLLCRRSSRLHHRLFCTAVGAESHIYRNIVSAVCTYLYSVKCVEFFVKCFQLFKGRIYITDKSLNLSVIYFIRKSYLYDSSYFSIFLIDTAEFFVDFILYRLLRCISFFKNCHINPPNYQIVYQLQYCQIRNFPNYLHCFPMLFQLHCCLPSHYHYIHL